MHLGHILATDLIHTVDIIERQHLSQSINQLYNGRSEVNGLARVHRQQRERDQSVKIGYPAKLREGASKQATRLIRPAMAFGPKGKARNTCRHITNKISIYQLDQRKGRKKQRKNSRYMLLIGSRLISTFTWPVKQTVQVTSRDRQSNGTNGRTQLILDREGKRCG